MSSRFAAWLCLIGAAACSHNNPEPAATADDVHQPDLARSEPAMTPASLETNRPAMDGPASSPSTATTPAATTGSDGSSGVRAPGAADTMGTSSSPQPSTSPGTQPDNTKVNERDKSSASPTPPDQKENESDLKITQHVRQAVMADGSLSFTAKNVKIISQNGKVTLRGPVKTAQERDAIEAAARKVAGVTQVDNQIEVKK